MVREQDEHGAQSSGSDPQTTQAWSEGFIREHGREPSVQEYQNALNAGQILSDQSGGGSSGPARDASVQQLSDGVKQIGQGIKGLYETKVAPSVERSGAKELFTEKIAPASQSAAQAARRGVRQAGTAAEQRSVSQWVPLALLVMAGAGVLAIISLFLPAITYGFGSINFFHDGEGEGAILLVLFLLVIAGAVLAFLTQIGWARAGAAVVGILFGLLGTIDGFGNMIGLDGRGSVGFGLVLLALTSLVIFVCGVVVAFSLWQERNSARSPDGS